MEQNIEAAVRRFSSKQMFLKFRIFHSKTTVLESAFNKTGGLQATLLKQDVYSIRVYSCEICKMFKNTIFYRALQVATCGTIKVSQALICNYSKN